MQEQHSQQRIMVRERILWAASGAILLSLWWQFTQALEQVRDEESISLYEYWHYTSIPDRIISIALLTACCFLVYCIHWYHQQMQLDKLTGMPVMHHPTEGSSYPFVGQLLNFIRYRPWDLLTRFHERYGPIVCFPLLGKTMFSIASPELLRIVLQSKIQSVKKDVANTMKHFLVILGTGIVTSENKSWMHQRVKMSQPLRKDVLTMIPKQTLAAVQKLMQQMDAAAAAGNESSQKVALGAALRHLTLQVISGTFLSLTADESDTTFAQLYLPIVDESNARVWHPYRAYLFFLPFWWKYLWTVRRLNVYVSHLIRQRWQLRRQTRGTNDAREQDILDKVLSVYEHECGNAIPQTLPETAVRQFRDEMKTFMLAGHETSAAMMTWALYELMGDKSRLEDPLLKESASVFDPQIDWATATANDLPDADALAQLKYSEACLRESLRKYSVVPIVARRTVEDLRMNDYFIPKGSSCLINIQAVHWNPEYWPEPAKFDPNRFLTDEPLKPYTFLPFIAGPRNCLGQHLALLESKMVISWLVQRYKLSLDEPVETADWTGERDPRHRYMVPVVPKEELMVRVERRKNN